MKELRALGARSVPVVSRGKDWIFPQMLTELAKFLGVEYDPAPKLSPQQLVDRLDMVMSTAQRLVAQIPDPKLDDNLRNRKRPIRNLCYHIFRLTDAFMEVVDGVPLTRDLLNPPAPNHIRTTADLVAYGKDVQERFRKWWAAYEPKDGSQLLETYYGRQPLHYVLERHTWHPAQHCRQVAMLLEEAGIQPNGPLTAKDLEDLPIPEKVWDDEQAAA